MRSSIDDHGDDYGTSNAEASTTSTKLSTISEDLGSLA